MYLKSEKEKINKYLSSTKPWPIIVDLQTKSELTEIRDYFNIGVNKILSAEKFCGQDGTFKYEELSNAVENNEGNTLITGLTAFLKINGDKYAKESLKKLVSKSISGHVVIITYQCKLLLNFSDTRITESGRIVIGDSEPDETPNIVLISHALSGSFPHRIDGFEKLGSAFESCTHKNLFIATNVQKSSFPNATINIEQLNDGYDILCSKDSRTKNIPKSAGTSEQWNYALKLMGSQGDWNSILKSQFNISSAPASIINKLPKFNDMQKWLYYIELCILGIKDNEYLQIAVNNAYSSNELIKSIFRAILNVDHTRPDFSTLYSQRKDILRNFMDLTADIVEFCKVVSVKGKDYIYYLTDLTQPEKERVIEWLDLYGNELSGSELSTILKWIYPDLGKYLAKFRFKNALLDEYFEKYKYQKLVNKILPSFEAMVDEQSTKFDFLSALKPRTSIVDTIDVTDSHAYFCDAMGVEYLGFIQEKCNQYGLTANISCARCELPSLTSFNKDFVSTFASKGCAISDIKELDEIKHHGENSFDYEKIKMPIYLIRELEIIDELLSKIKANIYSGTYKKAVIVSDHGASRLAVLHDTENVWKMETSGVHSGRCCPVSDINTKPDFAVEEEGYWVLANYDRFQGGRKANCEVHGGATIEEVAVPIIEITMKNTGIEAFIVDASKVISLSAKEFAVVKIYVGIKSNNISIKINGDYYDATPTHENYIYTVELKDYTKKGKFTFDILNGSDVIAKGQAFEIKKKGFETNNLFG